MGFFKTSKPQACVAMQGTSDQKASNGNGKKQKHKDSKKNKQGKESVSQDIFDSCSSSKGDSSKKDRAKGAYCKGQDIMDKNIVQTQLMS